MLAAVWATLVFVPGLHPWRCSLGAVFVVPTVLCVAAGSYPWKAVTYRDRYLWGLIQSFVFVELYINDRFRTIFVRITDFEVAWKSAIFLAVYSCGFMAITQGIATVLARRLRDDRESSLLCSSCGYNLTGNVSGICPECGEPIRR